MKKAKWTLGIVALAALALAAGCGKAESEHDHAGHDHAGHDHGAMQEGTDMKDGAMAQTADAANSAAKPYTLDTCIVSDEKLDSMGEPVVKIYDGQEVKFCCSNCIEDFEKDKAKFLTKLEKK